MYLTLTTARFCFIIVYMKRAVFLYDQIFEMIRTEILPTGKKLPSEQALSDRFGCSRKTVRNALNRLKQESAIYSIQGSGNYVASQNTKKIAIIIPWEYTNNSTLADGIESSAIGCEYHLEYFFTENLISQERRALQSICGGDYAGVISWPVPFDFTDIDLFVQLKQRHIPLVFIDSYICPLNVPVVVSESKNATKSVIRQFINRGHTKIAFFRLHRNITATERNRFEGYIEAHIESGIGLNNAYIFNSKEPNCEEELPDFFDYYEALEDKFTAVFCINDITASRLLDYAKQRYGDYMQLNLAICGFDNLECSKEMNFSTVQQNFFAIGKTAGTILKKLISGNYPKKLLGAHIELPSKPIIRHIPFHAVENVVQH